MRKCLDVACRDVGLSEFRSSDRRNAGMLECRNAGVCRDVEMLKKALLAMSQEDAEYHMKRCVDSGLWQTQG